MSGNPWDAPAPLPLLLSSLPLCNRKKARDHHRPGPWPVTVPYRPSLILTRVPLLSFLSTNEKLRQQTQTKGVKQDVNSVCYLLSITSEKERKFPEDRKDSLNF